MKKWLLMTAALMALATSVAVAEDALNLGIGTCRTTANTATATTNNFTPVMPCDDPANAWTPRRFVCSFKNGVTLVQWQGTTIALDIQTGSTPIADFWDFNGCSGGALSGSASVVNGSNCTNPYILAPTDPQQQSDLPNIQVDVANGRIQYVADHVRNTLGVDLIPPASLGGYTANNVALSSDWANGTAALCAGCDVPACVNFTRMAYFSLSENRTIVKAELRSNVTWAGGTPGCAGITPSKNATWGQVKALYR